ncbi:hypothetical protein F5Y04DRAFT_6787 [Hypomontagnella monticulosa]|nr:hypothetical protein F5Y04DRAFT_6787 [Hypomontagnella monticulosa]
MGEEKGIASIPAAKGRQVEAMDTRPDASPYAGPQVLFYFKDGPPFSIPSMLLSKHPKLFCLREYHEWEMSIRLQYIPSDLGHVLVHYLLTGTYQCLQPKGSSPNEKSAAEFATSIRVYTIAQQYELSTLETLAKGEMERLGRDLSVMQLLDLMTAAHPTPWADDAWLYNYVRSHVEPLIKGSPVSSINGPSEEDGKTSSLASVLLKCMIGLWHERKDTIPAASDHLATNQHQKETHAAIVSEKGSNLNPKPELGDNQKRMSEVEGRQGESGEDKTKKKENSKEQANLGGSKEAWSTATLEPTVLKETSKPSKPSAGKVENGNNGMLPKALPSRDSGSTFPVQHKQPQGVPCRNSTPQASHVTKVSNPVSNQHGTVEIPLTTAAASHQDYIYDKTGNIDRLLHICSQEKFAGFSTEELRWRHECWGERLR